MKAGFGLNPSRRIAFRDAPQDEGTKQMMTQQD